MRTYLAALLQALVICLFLTPLVRALALRLGAVSLPGGRNLNKTAVPRLGGVAIAVSVFAPLLTLVVVDSSVALTIRQRAELTWGLVLGGGIVGLIGAIDDARGLRPSVKLLAQLLAATVAYVAGYRIHGVSLPFAEPMSFGPLSLPITLLWIVVVTNAVNLIDGLDGLAAGVVFCAAATNLVVAVASGESVGPVFVGLVMSAIMGALLGFLAYNFNPARIYMGDSGSYFLGFLLAACSIASPQQKASTTTSLLVPMLALGVPLFDTLLSVLRRWLQRKSILSADRGHLHHRLLDLGLTHRRAVLVFYAVSAGLSAASIALALGSDVTAGVVLVGSSAVLFGLFRVVRHLEHLARAPGVLSAETERLAQLLPELIISIQTQGRAALPSAIERMRSAGGFEHLSLVERQTAPEEHTTPLVATFEVGDARLEVHRRLPLSEGESALLRVFAATLERVGS